jgi:hypothetical protein
MSNRRWFFKTINILGKCGILGFYAGKSHNLIGQGIFHGDQDFFLFLNCPECNEGQFRDRLPGRREKNVKILFASK